MNEIPVTRSFLERLSTEELVRLADRYGMDIPPGLDRLFVIDELLELEAERRDEELPPELFEEAGFIEPVPLPEQYNITFIDVMIRDPLWAFVFWEIRSAEKESLETAPDFSGYYLKVLSIGGLKNEEVFTVSTGNEDTAWYLGFPPEDESGDRSYQVKLCAGKTAADAEETEEIILAESKVFHLPSLSPKKGTGQKGLYENPLICLSGAGDFPILRNGDRQSRIKVRGNSFPG